MLAKHWSLWNDFEEVGFFCEELERNHPKHLSDMKDFETWVSPVLFKGQLAGSVQPESLANAGLTLSQHGFHQN